jgi:RNA polymerase sigma factor (sigma-70 family)
MEQLDDRERRVIRLRYFEESSQAIVSRQMGISQMHVSRLEKRALMRLRDLLTGESTPRPPAPVSAS